MFKNLVIQTISLNFRLTKLKDRRLKMEKHLKVTEANMKKSIDFVIENMTFMFLAGIPRSVFLIHCGALRCILKRRWVEHLLSVT